jgi:hypothetical protein
MENLKDSYTDFLENFNIKEEDFLEYGRNSIIYVDYDIAQEEWNKLKNRITNNEKVYIRPYGNNGKNSKIFIDFIKFAFGNEHIIIDKNRNARAQNDLKKYTNLERKKDIQNYQVSHIFGRTKNPYMFECPWNIAYIPKIFDPFTGHESNGNWTTKFKNYYIPDVQEKFHNLIEEYNEIIKEKDIINKIDYYVENLIRI